MITVESDLSSLPLTQAFVGQSQREMPLSQAFVAEAGVAVLETNFIEVDGKGGCCHRGVGGCCH